MSIKITAVIVTRNRIELLKQCLHSVLNQTIQPNQVIVIDNDSTDGTREYLSSVSGIDFIKNENTGGAGGFRLGIDLALEAGADWIWCMDDDGRPALDALEKIRPYLSPEFSAVNSLVLPSEESQTSSFFLVKINPGEKPSFFKKTNRISEIRKVAEEKGFVYYGSLLNGTFINREVLSKSGNVDPRFFIWGDEVDFLWRLWKIAPIITVPDSLHFHPAPSTNSAPAWKLYYGLRNHIHINKKYFNFSFLRNILLILRYLSAFLKSKAPLKMYFKAIADGISGNIHAGVRP
ncbi:glycosyltransferase [Leptospira perolatii]|nr:glycosyltransferase [Leptospira perolatii]